MRESSWPSILAPRAVAPCGRPCAAACLRWLRCTGFRKVPVRDNGSQRWDLYRLWREMRAALRQCNVARLESIGVDAWGCDYGLLREDGTLVD